METNNYAFFIKKGRIGILHFQVSSANEEISRVLPVSLNSRQSLSLSDRIHRSMNSAALAQEPACVKYVEEEKRGAGCI
ncbi:Protein of unknown function [Gryllus bimaculatus]|nr:Protein of unknown function [Gryllus bimaculatus]